MTTEQKYLSLGLGLGGVLGGVIAMLTTLVLTIHEQKEVKPMSMELAQLIVEAARAECKEKDRPFRIEGGDGFVSGWCGRK